MLAALIELTPEGVEQVDGEGWVEYALYGAPGELPSLPALTAAVGAALVEVRTEEIAGDWQDRWRLFHRPLVLDSRLTVRPPWEPAAGTPVDVVIDPGQAFGTGSHATTRLCLELMLEITPGAGPFVDLGCGSGVLAIAAARLGWGPVLALDNDPAAIRAAVENANRNAVSVDIRRYDLRTDPVDGSVAPSVAANLLAPLLRAWSRRLSSAAVMPERLIVGGLLAHEGDEIAAAFAACGLREAKRRTAGEWISLLLLAAPTPC